MNAILSAVRRLCFFGYYLYSLIAVPLVYNHSYKNGELSYLTKKDFTVWKSAMLKMLKEYCSAGYNFRIRQVIYSFANTKIEIIRKTEPREKNNPIVVLCIKNDLQRIKMLVDHYRTLGIKQFAFMDNGSDDGTFEWLQKQPDIDLFRCFDRYQTAVKEGWINRIVSYYGFNRWYILTDSDELGTFVGMEQHSIQDVIGYAEKNGIKRIKGLTIDMYADKNLFGSTEDIRGEYRWMDVDTYFEKQTTAGTQKYNCFLGGPRHRLMNSNINLSKYPLVYFEEGTISDSAHYQYPHTYLPTSPTFIGILHFKFIDKDMEEYKKRAQDNSGFSSNGLMYKQYIKYVESSGGTSFIYDGSAEFKDSSALQKIDLIETIQFE